MIRKRQGQPVSARTPVALLHTFGTTGVYSLSESLVKLNPRICLALPRCVSTTRTQGVTFASRALVLVNLTTQELGLRRREGLAEVNIWLHARGDERRL